MTEIEKAKKEIDKIIKVSKSEFLDALKSKNFENLSNQVIMSIKIDLMEQFKNRASSYVSNTYPLPENATTASIEQGYMYIPNREYLYLNLMLYASKEQNVFEEIWMEHLNSVFNKS